MRPESGIAAGLAVCSLAAVARTALSGQLAVSDKPTWFGAYVWCAFAFGMALAGFCYLRALRRPAEQLGRSHLAWAIGIHLCAAVATPLTSNDIFFNLAFGRLSRLGLNPYEHVSADLPRGDPFSHVDWPHWRHPYGPLVLVVSARAASANSVMWGMILFKLAMLATTVAAIGLAFRMARSSLEQEAPMLFALFGFNPVLAWELAGQAHNDALLILPMLASIAAARADRHVLVGFLLGVAVAAKFAAAPLLMLYCASLWREAGRALACATAAFAIIALCWAPFLAAGNPLSIALAAALPSPQRVLNSFASLIQLAGHLAADEGWALRRWTLVTRAALVLAALVLAIKSARRGSPFESALVFTTLALAACLSYVQPWYATWLLPLALAPVSRERRLLVAIYTAAMPALYLAGAAGALAIVVAHGTGLILLLRPVAMARFFGSGAEPRRASVP